MNSKPIITIGRQFGSGGREIGKKLAEALHMQFYDRDLIAMAAKQSGMSEEILSQNDEKTGGSLLYSLSVGSYLANGPFSGSGELPLENKLYLIQSEIIKKLAEEGPCVIVGRCADYVLRDRTDCLRVFIYADLESRVQRIEKLYNVASKKAKELILRTDKRRASYYNYYTDHKWNQIENYDLCVNSAVTDIAGAVKIITEAATCV